MRCLVPADPSSPDGSTAAFVRAHEKPRPLRARLLHFYCFSCRMQVMVCAGLGCVQVLGVCRSWCVQILVCTGLGVCRSWVCAGLGVCRSWVCARQVMVVHAMVCVGHIGCRSRNLCTPWHEHVQISELLLLPFNFCVFSFLSFRSKRRDQPAGPNTLVGHMSQNSCSRDVPRPGL